MFATVVTRAYSSVFSSILTGLAAATATSFSEGFLNFVLNRLPVMGLTRAAGRYDLGLSGGLMSRLEPVRFMLIGDRPVLRVWKEG